MEALQSQNTSVKMGMTLTFGKLTLIYDFSNLQGVDVKVMGVIKRSQPYLLAYDYINQGNLQSIIYWTVIRWSASLNTNQKIKKRGISASASTQLTRCLRAGGSPALCRHSVFSSFWKALCQQHGSEYKRHRMKEHHGDEVKLIWWSKRV